MKAFCVRLQPRRAALQYSTSTSISARLCGGLIGLLVLGGIPGVDGDFTVGSTPAVWAAPSGKARKGKSKPKKRGRRKKTASPGEGSSASGAEGEAAASDTTPAGSQAANEARLGSETAASFHVDTILDERSISRTRQADEKRNEAIEELKKLIPRARESQKAEMIFRLAELYWEKSKYKYGLEMDAYEKAHASWSDGGGQGPAPELKAFVRESDLIKRNALKLYEKVLTDYPDYPRNDAVLFYLGYNEYEDGEKKKAVDHYWTLVKRFPKSRLVPDAYLQLGEHFFSDNDVVRARKAFELALSTQEARVHNYALYKLAWCDYNVQEFERGIKRLKDVIERSEEGNKDRKAVQLKSEALRDLALFFSSVDQVEEAYAYFKAKGGEEIALRYMTALSSLYQKQGKWPLQVQSCRLLLEKFPMNDKAPELQAQIVQAYSQLNQKDKVRQEVERLVDLYRPGTPWSESQKARGAQGLAALEYAYDVTESSLRELVTDYHRDAQKRKDVATYKLARDIYAKYLDAFSDTDYAYQMRFFYAEVLWALKEWKHAAEEYGRVVRTKTEGKAPGKYARLAAYNAILAWEKMAAEGETGALTSGMKIVESKEKGRTDARRITKLRLKALNQGESYEEQTIPDVELSLSRACDVYFKIADPKDEELPAIKFKAAYVYYRHNHFVAAAERYFEIIERWPSDPLAKKSAHLIMDSLNVQEKWDELEKYARAFLDNERLAGRDPNFHKEVQALLQGAAYKSIQVAEVAARKLDDPEKGRALGAVARRFRRLRKEFPKSPYADKALYSAVLIYNQANQLDRAIKAATLMASAYKDSEYSAENLLLLAGFHERIADFEGSADLYTKFFETYHAKAKRNPNPKAADALFNAGIYYEGLGDTKRAADRFNTYVREFASRPDAADVYWRICDLSEQEKAWKQAAECFDAFQTRFKKADPGKVFESRYRVALNLEKQKKKPLALKEYKWLVSEFPKLPAAARESDGVRTAGARAAFELLEPEYESYRRLKVTLNRKSLLKKAQTADELACVSTDDKACKTQGKFLAILGYGSGDYGIAALTRMGQVYRGMADSIRSAPIPRNLTEDQLEIYRAELDSVALGPEEKAIEAFENALGKAYELNIYNAWTSLAQENLRELNPNKFPDPQKPKFMGADGLVVISIRGENTRPASGGGQG
ncbi:MAG: tetratricopeptide repeat protein [Deltaproteobacteria bacterium]|nr:tetratricopeptide repeat protein [Deltaproteobacteria bacterium]